VEKFIQSLGSFPCVRHAFRSPTLLYGEDHSIMCDFGQSKQRDSVLRTSGKNRLDEIVHFFQA
jgi:hypothetical protein